METNPEPRIRAPLQFGLWPALCARNIRRVREFPRITSAFKRDTQRGKFLSPLVRTMKRVGVSSNIVKIR